MLKLTLKDQILKDTDPLAFALLQIERAKEDFDTYLENLKKDLEKNNATIIAEVIAKAQILQKGNDGETPVKGVDYFDGEDGEAPTEAELLALIKPLVPKLPKVIKGLNGKTPTTKELLALIRPLLPKIEAVQKITDEQLIVLIKKLLPKEETGQTIAKKLNTTEETVEMSVIKGLVEKFKALSSSIRERKGGGSAKSGGGGMGNVVHETNAISSATTTVSTAQKIAANGNALWAYYQDGFIVKGADYTVGVDRKTLTLLFTPQDNTNINIVYVRS